MRLINTRPAERASQLTQELSQLDYTVYELPLLQLQAIALDASLIAQFQLFLQAEIVVVVSPIAAELGMQYYQQLALDPQVLQQKKWIAVGKKTQHCLNRFAIESICPEVENSEGMLQLPILHDLQGSSVAFWRGIGGREFLMQQLRKQQCHILNMVLYRREMPFFNTDKLTQLLTFLPAIVLITSEESWKNWLSLMQRSPELTASISSNIYLVLGERVTQLVQLGCQQWPQQSAVYTIAQLTAQTIHQCLIQLENNE